MEESVLFNIEIVWKCLFGLLNSVNSKVKACAVFETEIT